MFQEEKMRNGFTMIEVVFVVLITGVLASTALPRFVGLSEDAHTAKIQHFVGMLNNSIGAQLWAEVQRNEPNIGGSVKNSTHTNQIDSGRVSIPYEVNHGADITLANCAPSGTPVSVSLTPIATSNDDRYKIGCIDSSLGISPHFFLHDGSQILTQ